MQNVIGTGFSGLVGTALQTELANKYSFINWDLTNGVSILDPASLQAAYSRQPGSTLIHLAAFTNVDAAQEQANDKSGSCYQVNVTGTQNIVNLCQEKKIHLIHLSTGYVFDGQKNEPYQETDPLNPTDWYSQTKAEAEEIVTSQLPTATVLRINFPYWDQPATKPDIWHKLALALESGKTGPFFDDHFFTLTPLTWFAQVVDWCLTNRPGGVFHATTSTVYTDYSLALAVAAQLDLQVKLQKSSVQTYNQTASRPYQPSLILDNTKLKQVMGNQFPQHE